MVWVFGGIKVGQFRYFAPTYFRYLCIFPESFALSNFSPSLGRLSVQRKSKYIMTFTFGFLLWLCSSNFIHHSFLVERATSHGL